MKNMNRILILFLLIISLPIYSEEIITINNKVFLKEMKKAIPDGTYQLKEIDLPWHISSKGAFYTINTKNENEKIKFVYFGRAVTIRGNAGNQAKDASEYFDYFILYDVTKTVKLVRVYRYRASYGEGITSQGWLKQFIGYNGKNTLEVGKNIDAISGATISTNVITHDIETQTGILHRLKE
jgi:hypothetical protein